MIAVPAIWLLVATPRNPATGAVVTVRLAGGGRQGYKQFGSVAWLAGLERPPAIVQTLGYGDEGFGDGAAVQALELDWGGSKARAVTLGSYYWSDAGFTLYSGPDGGADADMAVVLTGRMAGVLPSPARLKLQMADPAVDLAKPAITATFAGTGGIEGDPEIKGQVKWRGWGKCFNVELRSLLKASNIHVATDPTFPINAIAQVYDRGNAAAALTVVAWAGSIAATLAALMATAAPGGGAAVAPSIGCIKWWYATPGKLTCDIEGEIGAGYVDRPADIAARLVGLQGLAIDATMLTAARVARNDEAGWLIDDASSSVAGQLQALLSGVSLWWALSPVGVVEIGPWEWGAAVASFKSERIERQAAYKPFAKAVLGWKPNHTIMQRGDIAQNVLYADVSGTPANLAAINAGEGAKLTGIEAGADVTLTAQVVIDLVSQKTIAADYLGALIGSLPSTFSPSVKKSGTSIKTDNPTTYAITKLSDGSAGADGGTASVDNTNGSSTKGDVSVSAFTTGSIKVSFRLTISVSGIAVAAIDCALEKSLGDPPGGGSGGGGTKLTTVAADQGQSSASTYAKAHSAANPQLVVGSGEKLYATTTITYLVNGSSGARYGIFKQQYSTDNATWTDFGAAVNGTNATPGRYLSGEYIDPVEGSATVNQNVTVSAGTYYVRTVFIISSGSRTITCQGENITFEAKP